MRLSFEHPTFLKTLTRLKGSGENLNERRDTGDQIETYIYATSHLLW